MAITLQRAARGAQEEKGSGEGMKLVTNDDLIAITGGLRQGAAQIRWIKKMLGIDAPRKIDGHPMITWDQINQRSTTSAGKSKINWQKSA